MLHSICDQPDVNAVAAQLHRASNGLPPPGNKLRDPCEAHVVTARGFGLRDVLTNDSGDDAFSR